VTLQQALALHQAGRLTEAEAGYRKALAEQPGNPMRFISWASWRTSQGGTRTPLI
jgi:hypothetical protein